MLRRWQVRTRPAPRHERAQQWAARQPTEATGPRPHPAQTITFQTVADAPPSHGQRDTQSGSWVQGDTADNPPCNSATEQIPTTPTERATQGSKHGRTRVSTARLDSSPKAAAGSPASVLSTAAPSCLEDAATVTSRGAPGPDSNGVGDGDGDWDWGWAWAWDKVMERGEGGPTASSLAPPSSPASSLPST